MQRLLEDVDWNPSIVTLYNSACIEAHDGSHMSASGFSKLKMEINYTCERMQVELCRL